MLAISQELVVVFSPWESVLGTVDMTFFIVITDLILFHVFFELLRLDSKYFCSNFVYFFSKGLLFSFYDFCILNEVLDKLPFVSLIVSFAELPMKNWIREVLFLLLFIRIYPDQLLTKKYPNRKKKSKDWQNCLRYITLTQYNMFD